MFTFSGIRTDLNVKKGSPVFSWCTGIGQNMNKKIFFCNLES